MFITIVLGFVFWGIMTWVKRRFLKSANLSKWDDLPKELRDPPKESNKPRKTYAEARKEYLERNKKNPKPMNLFDEAKLLKEVTDKHGYYRADANEGAFALYEQRKQEREARLEVKKELEKRMEAELGKHEFDANKGEKTKSE